MRTTTLSLRNRMREWKETGAKLRGVLAPGGENSGCVGVKQTVLIISKHQSWLEVCIKHAISKGFRDTTGSMFFVLFYSYKQFFRPKTSRNYLSLEFTGHKSKVSFTVLFCLFEVHFWISAYVQIKKALWAMSISAPLSACSFSSTIQPIWYKFRRMFPLDPVILQIF